jgi:hypothetical protein
MRTGLAKLNAFAAGLLALLALAWPGDVRTQPGASTAGLESLIDRFVEQLGQVFMLRVFHVDTIC